MKTKSLNFFFSIIVLGSIIFASSCKVSTQSGEGSAAGDSDSIVISKKLYNGSKMVEWEVRFKKLPDGTKMRDGISTRYLKSGKLAETINYANGKKNGSRIFFHTNGKPWRVYEFVNDKKHGAYKKYDQSGRLKSEITYNMNYPGTDLKEYYDSGKEMPNPTIVTSESNEIRQTGYYKITATLSGPVKERVEKVEFYEGILVDGKFFNPKGGLTAFKELSPLKGDLLLSVPKGSFIDSNLNIVAVITTKNKQTLILQKKIHVAVRGV